MAHVFQTFQTNGKPHPRWRFEYRDRWGRKRKGTGYPTKSDTVKLAHQIEADEQAIRLGYKEAPKPAAQPKKFRTVADEYLDWGETQGGRGGRPWGWRHGLNRRRQMQWWEDQLKPQMLGDLVGSLSRVETLLRSLLRQGRTGRTVAQYGETLHAFCAWCIDREYLAENPLRRLSSFDITPLVFRRALSREEIFILLDAAPTERRLVYEVALCTGLRANELRSLTVAHLDVKNSGLTLDAAWTKNRKPGFQPLPSSLVERLVEFSQTDIAETAYDRWYVRKDVGIAPKQRLLYVPKDPARAFHRDLQAAGIAKSTPEGKLDFHALRVTFATFVIESGATVKEAQTLLRHSTPELTMNVYARVRKGRLAEVAEDVASAFIERVNSVKKRQIDANNGQLPAPKEPQSLHELKLAGALIRSMSEGYNEMKMAERAGFEPAVHLSAYTRFPSARLQPLGHLSARCVFGVELAGL